MSVSSQVLIKGAANHDTGIGVNVAGYLRTESGVGTAVRRYVRALRSLQIPLSLQDLSDLQGNRSNDQTLRGVGGDAPHAVNLVCADVELHYAILSHLGEAYFRDHYNIGIWAWELPRFPERWFDRFAFYDEIWVGTSFVANALAPVCPLPVVRIPPVLTVESVGSREAGRRRLGVDDETVFLFIFDLHSHLDRKNPLAVIDAFRMAFRPTDAVRLVLKCVNADAEALALLRARAGKYPVDIQAGYWPAAQVRDLMAACDVYVSLHRSEGTGLTISDAMAQGKPVIATGWSGNLDFMTVANSFLVRYELVEIERGVGPYREGETWAEPSVEHAAELMRNVVAHRDEAEARGQTAREDIELHFSEAAVAGLIWQRLDAIHQRRRTAELQDQAWEAYRTYRQLGAALRERLRHAVPAGATTLVVTKGDEALLDLDGRPAWHFPRGEGGEYAGYYPADSTAAIEHLEALRGLGGEYLVFPTTARWWLDAYPGFREHLDARYRRAADDQICVVYDLSAMSGQTVVHTVNPVED
jgi:glycosyltransferase involved in cell wall biosynthesis